MKPSFRLVLIGIFSMGPALAFTCDHANLRGGGSVNGQYVDSYSFPGLILNPDNTLSLGSCPELNTNWGVSPDTADGDWNGGVAYIKYLGAGNWYWSVSTQSTQPPLPPKPTPTPPSNGGGSGSGSNGGSGSGGGSSCAHSIKVTIDGANPTSYSTTFDIVDDSGHVVASGVGSANFNSTTHAEGNACMDSVITFANNGVNLNVMGHYIIPNFNGYAEFTCYWETSPSFTIQGMPQSLGASGC